MGFFSIVKNTYYVAVVLAAFLGAFLLFQVQPMLGKYILPAFGGVQTVWIVSMLFFQVMLILGYAYAYASVKYLKPPAQALFHSILLFLVLFFLPITPDLERWKFDSVAHPVGSVLGLLATSVGLPFFILASTAPLLQVWLAKTSSTSPYRLYALSNAASLVALLSYPLFFELVLTNRQQIIIWSGMFVLYVAVFLLAGLVYLRILSEHLEDTPRSLPPLETPVSNGVKVLDLSKIPAASPGRIKLSAASSRASLTSVLIWVGLAATGSLLMLATTSAITQDVGGVPLLWVLPLALYLLTYALCFDSSFWYPRGLFSYLFIFCIFLWLVALQLGASAPLVMQSIIYLFIMFTGCMICHGELVRHKPDLTRLTVFYLCVAVGGALGGFAAGIVAPAVFKTTLELPISLGLVLAIVLYYLYQEGLPIIGRDHWNKYRRVLLAGFVVLIAVSYYKELGAQGVIYRGRNFFGTLRVVETRKDDSERYLVTLYNGRIVHGVQFADSSRRNTPTSYYGTGSGVGILFNLVASRQDVRVGVIGLGAGTLAAYADEGDYIRFYEINPQVIEVAGRYFTYLQDLRAATDIILGDARLSMEAESPQRFDILAVDAFSGDAIPVHLLTEDALAVYLKHLNSNGVVAFHITNRHLDLRPVVKALADKFGLKAVLIRAQTDMATRAYASDWVLVSRNNPGWLEEPVIVAAADKSFDNVRSARLWTDDYSNLLRVLR